MEEERPYRILIVDDQQSDLALLEEILKNRGYEVITALSGPESLDILNTNENIDLILLDVMMPEMDGLELCKTIKSIEKLKDIPIIFSTSLKDELSQLKGFLAAAVDYIRKPYNPIILYARVQAHIELKVSRDKMRKLLVKQEKLIEDLNKARTSIIGFKKESVWSDQGNEKHI